MIKPYKNDFLTMVVINDNSNEQTKNVEYICGVNRTLFTCN